MAARGRLLVLAVPDRRRVVVLVAGEADHESAPLLREKIVDSLFHRPCSLLVDATDLTFCDLSGLDALVDAFATVERAGVHARILPSVQLAWLITTVERLPRSSGQPGRAPADRPRSHRSRQTA